MFETILVFTYVYNIAKNPLAKFFWLCYITLYNANSLKIPLSNASFVSLVKAKAFPFKKKIKGIFFTELNFHFM